MRMGKSYEDFMGGNTATFVKLLEEFFYRRHTRSVAETQESNLQIAIELV